jgi:hypothetical protein
MSGGFKLVGTDSQGDVTGKQKTFTVNASLAEVITAGDLVVITGGSDANGRAEIELAPTGTACTGVVMSVDPTFAGEALSTSYHPASTLGSVKVNVDPNALYEVDVLGTLSAADVGFNAPAVVTAATISGSLAPSVMEVNDTGAAVTATLPLHIVALKKDSAGVLGNVAIVRINASTVAPGALGIS